MNGAFETRDNGVDGLIALRARVAADTYLQGLTDEQSHVRRHA